MWLYSTTAGLEMTLTSDYAQQYVQASTDGTEMLCIFFCVLSVIAELFHGLVVIEPHPPRWRHTAIRPPLGVCNMSSTLLTVISERSSTDVSSPPMCPSFAMACGHFLGRGEPWLAAVTSPP